MKKKLLKIILPIFVLFGCSEHVSDPIHQVSQVKKLYFPTNKKELLVLLEDIKIPLESIDVSKIEDMSYLFDSTYGRDNLDGLKYWNVKATNMKFMFSDKRINKYPQWYLDFILKNPTYTPKNRKELNEIMKDPRVCNVEIDVSNIKNFSSLFDMVFGGFTKMAGIEYWDMRNAEDLSNMFFYNHGDIPVGIENWKLPNAKTMRSMFLNTEIQNYPKWYIDFVKKNPTFRPKNKQELIEAINHTKTFGIPSLSFRIRDASLIEIDVSAIKDLSYIFCTSKEIAGCQNEIDNFNGIQYWNVSNAENMERIFMGSRINIDLSHWDVGRVKNFYEAFARTPFNQNISNWKVQKDAIVKGMFLDSALEKEGKIPNWAK